MPKPFKGAMPYFGNRIPDILKDVESILVSGHLSQGSFQKKFESQFATLTRTKYALAVNSGGTALELVFNALNNPGAEVIIPTDTFVASASAARRASWKIRFADISSANLCLDIDGIEKTIKPETEAIMMVYMFGIIPANLNELVQLCKERNLFLIEDASHAHGASYRGKMIGSIGHAACFSMYATKIITTGEGGVITTSSEEIANRIVQLRNHGKSLTSPLFEEISNNFRLSEIQASIGIHQLELLPEIIEHRQQIAHIYHSILSQQPEMLSCIEIDPESQHSFWRFPALLRSADIRNKVQFIMNTEYDTRITWLYEPGCHQQPLFLKDNNPPEQLPVAEELLSRLICLPCHQEISISDAGFIADSLVKCISSIQ